jgi:hypothetical protein
MIIVSYATEDGVYDVWLDRLRASCEKHGLKHDMRKISARTAHEAYHYKPGFVLEMVDKYPGESIVWMDADAVVSASFTLPDDGWDVGLIPNNMKHLRKAAPVANFIGAIAPTPAGRDFIACYAYLCAWPKTLHADHGMLIISREILKGLYKEIDITGAIARAVIRDFGRGKQNMVLKPGAAFAQRVLNWLRRRGLSTR